MGDGGWEEKVSWAGLAGPWLLPVLASLGFMGCGGLVAAPALPRPAPATTSRHEALQELLGLLQR